MAGSKPPRDDLAARLERAQAARERTDGKKSMDGQDAGILQNRDGGRQNGLSFGFRVGVDLVSALAVGVGIGFSLDQWLGTKPWLLVMFFFLGAAAGVLNVYRALNGMGYAVGFRRQGAERASRDRDDAAGTK